MGKAKFEIREWPDVDLVIEDIGRAAIARDKLEGQLNVHIADLKARFGGRIQELDQQIADWTARLEAFCAKRRGEMDVVKGGKGCVHKGVFGKAAFRACPPAIVFTKKAEKVLAALRARRLFDCIRTVEEPNKDVMAALDAETLAAVHAKKKPSEQFEVKPDYQAIESTIVTNRDTAAC